MRSHLFLAVFLPAVAAAQINRSAREFAGEQIREYVAAKLFKGFSYKPGSFGQLKTHKDEKKVELAWSIVHEFEITDTRKVSDNAAAIPKAYKFLFYLDDKMKVLKAESFYTY